MTWRFWFEDGSAVVESGGTYKKCEQKAIAFMRQSVRGLSMSEQEKREAVTVDYAVRLDK